MKKIHYLLLALLLPFQLAAQKNFEVHYFEQEPFAYQKDGKPAGIEIDILRKFAEWCKSKKSMEVSLTYVAHKDFDDFYGSVRNGAPNVIGAGSVSITDSRKLEVQFSPPYMKNTSVLISDGRIKTLSDLASMSPTFDKLKGITTKGSIHAKYMNDLKKYLPGLVIENVEQPLEIPKKIAADPAYFGYVDIITFWNFIRKNAAFIKLHRAASVENERMGYILPQQSDVMPLISEFFESGFGFTATKSYEEVLEKYLGYEIISSVEID